MTSTEKHACLGMYGTAIHSFFAATLNLDLLTMFKHTNCIKPPKT